MSKRLLMVCALCAAACTTKRTEVVIGVATDLPAPGALDQVKLEIYRNNVLAFDIPPWDVPGTAQGQFILPASFGVYADDGSEPRVEVLVHGIKNNQITVTRRAILSLIKEKTLFLRMALVQRCASRAECPDPSASCVEGRCKSAIVDPRALPVYSQGIEGVIACSSGTNFISTAGNMPLPVMGACTSSQYCEEGVCYNLVPTGLGDGGVDGGVTIPGSSGWSQLTIPPAESPPARRFDNSSQAAADATTFLVWGGRDVNNQPVADTWGFRNGQWIKLANDIGPAGADPTGPTVFDPGSSKFVTYREPSGDLIDFDGTSWIVLSMGGATGSPPARTQSALVVDEAHGKLELIGGLCGASPCNDQWVFDGTTWSQKGVATVQARRAVATIFDPGLNAVLLFGGRDATTQYTDTWKFDGTTWTQLATTFPNPVVFSVAGGLLTYDSDQSRILWLNGTREVYSFNGTAWTQTFVDPNGPLLGTFSGAYFKQIKAIMAFGGSDSHNTPLALTWVLNVP
jgi:hypothetical protein